MPPLICVPTTTGLASDVSQYTLITDSMKPRWSTIVSKLLVPDVSINDPFTLLTLGKETCIDNALVTLNLAIEAYVSNMSSPLTDTYALDAIEFLGKNITTVINKQEDIEIKGWLMMAGLKAGLAYSNAGLGINHSMAQALSAHGDASYGTCATIVAPHTIAYNHASSPTRYENIARHITSTVTPQHNPVDTLVSFMKTLQETAGITISRVSQRPIPHPSVLADTAIQHPSNATNPRVPTTTDIEALFTKALES
jgi:alcohol dehydrogenase class IV